jgi:hypothetical protein
VTDFDTWDRCITRGFPTSMFPNRYNNGIRVWQAPGYVVIQTEMLGLRVIPIGDSPPWPAAVEQWMGHSRAHWEGKTLVIETNNFNEGTTIASVADMQDMIFQGYVDESEVGKVKESMPVSISIGALVGQKFQGTLEYIAPKGTSRDGTIEFEVRAALELQPGSFVRANYSANADIILEKRP